MGTVCVDAAFVKLRFILGIRLDQRLRGWWVRYGKIEVINGLFCWGLRWYDRD